MYYAVIFASQLKKGIADYEQTALKMEQLAMQQQGYISHNSFRNSDGYGVTISYWHNLKSIKQWAQNIHHLKAKQRGKNQWYSWYNLKTVKISFNN